MRGRSGAAPTVSLRWLATTVLAGVLFGQVRATAATDAPPVSRDGTRRVPSGAPSPATPGARTSSVVVIDAIGDSITAGYVHSGDANGRRAQFDPEGGYPGRLGMLLDDGTRIRRRGVGGSTLATWTAEPRGNPADLEALLRSLWPDLPSSARLPRPRQSALSWTLDVDRPDVVILLLGVNDLWLDALVGGPPDARGAAGRVSRAAASARARGSRVLVATLLPNARDPEGALEEFNRTLCELEPDCLRLDRDFARAGGTALLGDEIHPSPAGHQAIAESMADALVAAGISHRRTHAPGGQDAPAETGNDTTGAGASAASR